MGKLFFGSSWWLCWLKVVMEQELMTGHSHVLVLAMQLYAGFFSISNTDFFKFNILGFHCLFWKHR